jgi:hypothetical protein
MQQQPDKQYNGDRHSLHTMPQSALGSTYLNWQELEPTVVVERSQQNPGNAQYDSTAVADSHGGTRLTTRTKSSNPPSTLHMSTWSVVQNVDKLAQTEDNTRQLRAQEEKEQEEKEQEEKEQEQNHVGQSDQQLKPGHGTVILHETSWNRVNSMNNSSNNVRIRVLAMLRNYAKEGKECSWLPKLQREARECKKWTHLIGPMDEQVRRRLCIVKYLCSVDNSVQYSVRVDIRFTKAGTAEVWWVPRTFDIKEPDSLNGKLSIGTTRSCGTLIQEPRLSTSFGNMPYKYSNVSHPVNKRWPREIASLCVRCNDLLGYTCTSQLCKPGVECLNPECGKLNHCLVNELPNGASSVGEHGDDEKCIGMKSIAAVVSGCPRVMKFRVKNKSAPNKLVCSIVIEDGTYFMTGDPKFQSKFTHQIDKVYASFMTKIRAHINGNVDEYPEYPRDVPLTDEGAKQAPNVQWAWIAENIQSVRTLVQSGAISNSQAMITNYLGQLDFWVQSRTSYTFRNLIPDKPSEDRKRKSHRQSGQGNQSSIAHIFSGHKKKRL